MSPSELLAEARSRAREYFRLAGAEAAAARVTSEARAEARALLCLASQKHRAATQLSANGLVSEALPLALDGLRAAVRSAERLGAWTEGAPRADLGLSRREQRRVGAALRTGVESARPVYEREVTSAHRASLLASLSALEALQDACATLCWSPMRRAATRWTRSALGAAAAALALGALLWLVVPRHEVEATASNHWGGQAEYGPANAIDGAPATEWLLNDGTVGWIDLHLKPARPVRRIRLLNAHNRSQNDRGTQGWRVELFSGGRVIAAREGRFEAFSPEPAWVDVDASGAAVEVVRVHVLSWFLKGGGFAEIEVR